VITQDKNHIPWNKNHITPVWKPSGFSRQSYRSLTGKRQSICKTKKRIRTKSGRKHYTYRARSILYIYYMLMREIWIHFNIPWNKNHITPVWKPSGFSRQSYRSLTGKRQSHSERCNMIFISRNMIFVLCDHVFWFLPIVQSN
jgi:hypothetical protein